MAENALAARPGVPVQNAFYGLYPAAVAGFNALMPDYLREPALQNVQPGGVGKVPQTQIDPLLAGVGGALDIASLGAGGAAKAAAPLVAAIPAARRGIRAYHGSPHDFERFSLDKIGTGEGAQAYGHGLYFAENEGVARGYRERLAPGVQQLVGDQAFDAGSPVHLASSYLNMFGKRGKSREEIARILREETPYKSPAHEEAAQLVLSGEKLPTYSQREAGRMYEVNINADPARFLDWDKPLGQQSPEIGQAIAAAGGTPRHISVFQLGNKWLADDGVRLRKFDTEAEAQMQIARGADAYKSIPRNPSSASDALRDAGIPGIRYLDGGSRGAGQGSSNYVVFDDKLIDIIRKYGLAGIPATGVAAGAANALYRDSN